MSLLRPGVITQHKTQTLCFISLSIHIDDAVLKKLLNHTVIYLIAADITISMCTDILDGAVIACYLTVEICKQSAYYVLAIKSFSIGIFLSVQINQEWIFGNLIHNAPISFAIHLLIAFN